MNIDESPVIVFGSMACAKNALRAQLHGRFSLHVVMKDLCHVHGVELRRELHRMHRAHQYSDHSLACTHATHVHVLEENLRRRHEPYVRCIVARESRAAPRQRVARRIDVQLTRAWAREASKHDALAPCIEMAAAIAARWQARRSIPFVVEWHVMYVWAGATAQDYHVDHIEDGMQYATLMIGILGDVDKGCTLYPRKGGSYVLLTPENEHLHAKYDEIDQFGGDQVYMHRGDVLHAGGPTPRAQSPYPIRAFLFAVIRATSSDRNVPA